MLDINYCLLGVPNNRLVVDYYVIEYQLETWIKSHWHFDRDAPVFFRAKLKKKLCPEEDRSILVETLVGFIHVWSWYSRTVQLTYFSQLRSPLTNYLSITFRLQFSEIKRAECTRQSSTYYCPTLKYIKKSEVCTWIWSQKPLGIHVDQNFWEGNCMHNTAAVVCSNYVMLMFPQVWLLAVPSAPYICSYYSLLRRDPIHIWLSFNTIAFHPCIHYFIHFPFGLLATIH